MKKHTFLTYLSFDFILLLVIFIISMVSALNLSSINKDIASIRGASYDFIVSGFVNQTDEQKIIENAETFSFNRTINFNTNINSKKSGNVLLSRDSLNFNLSFLDSTIDLTLFDPTNHIIIDEMFSRYHSLKKGDEVTFTLNGNPIILNVFKVVLHTPLPNFINGTAYGAWNQSYESFFTRYLVADYMFVETLNQSNYERFMDNNNFSYLNREILLNDHLDIRTNEYSYFLIVPIIIIVILLLTKIYWLKNNLLAKTKEFLIAIKENRINENITYKKHIHNSVIFNFIAFVCSQIVVYLLVSYLNFFWIVVISNLAFYFLNFLFSVRLTSKFIPKVSDLYGNIKRD